MFRQLTTFRTYLAVVVALISIGLIRWSVVNEDLSPPAVKAWQQPLSLLKPYPELINAQKWKIDFTPIDALLLQLQFSEKNELIIDDHTRKLLERIISLLPVQLDQSNLQRVAFLMTKSLPAANAQPFADLFLTFYHFQPTKPPTLETAETDINTETIDDHMRFQQLVSRRQKTFGPTVAAQLFGNQEKITRYLLERRATNEDPKLDRDQKQRQLLIIQNKFQHQHQNSRAMEEDN